MPSFAAVVETATLSGTTGFRIVGPAADAEIGISQFGTGSIAVGDIDHDGHDDLLIGAPTSTLAGAAGAGGFYVVFGGPTSAASRTLGTLSAGEGFAVSGPTTARFGGGVGSGFDFNGDGVEDFAASAMNLTFTASAVYIVFGQDGGFTGGAFSALTLDGDNGFRLTLSGSVPLQDIASAGDLNGDGLDDLVITGAGGPSGCAYVLFGGQDLSASFALSGLDGTNGFAVSNLVASASRAISAAGGGDIDGDGIDDLVLGARYAEGQDGAAYVIFGRDTSADGAFAATVDVNALDGSNGFTLAGGNIARVGREVTWLDDINGDGLDDLAVTSASLGEVYIVFGRDTAIDGDFAADLDLAALDGSNGFRLVAGSAADALGVSIAGSEDINGDGYSDLVVGAPGAESARGRAYVLFGGGSFAAVVDLTALDGSDGFVIRGETTGDRLGFDLALGDVNGDGLADIVLGASSSDLGGADSGAVYVVYGIQADLTLTGTVAADAIDGKTGADTISGLAGEDVINGLDGDDLLDGGDARDLLYGGAGADDLLGGAGGDMLDGGVGVDQMAGGIGDDTYVVDDVLDVCLEQATEGSDRVRSGVSYTLGDNLDHLQLIGAGDIDATGNGLANQLDGNGGANILDGGGGADIIRGGLGADTLIGGTQNDILVGGGGADRFDVRQDSIGTGEVDTISDYAIGQDIIDLSAIDAIAGGSDNAFAIVSAFTKMAGQLVLRFSGGSTTLTLDVDGDAKADYLLRINGDVRGDTAGWVL